MNRVKGADGLNNKIIEWITDHVKNYKFQNNTESDWRDPIVGFANAEDEMFLQLKKIIGPTHAMPHDLVPSAKSVITFFIPFSKKVIKSNIGGEESSKEWDIASIETNNLIGDLNKYLFDKITEKGYKASLLPATYNYDEVKLKSDWSHRSVAYISGIGKFGVNNMFITERGCCGRLGSIVTDMKLKATIRNDEEYCLFKHDGSCKKCIEKCVNDAFTLKNQEVVFDRKKCNEQIYEKIIPEYEIGIGDTCGKCLCGVPCSMTIPIKYQEV
ncbi:epoxyqueuosine reductase [Alkalibacter mobilis]|uniref:epoxyqueuosine reductase n=1 Tax=Alkalibacter mobilis TaxID=2787712 RepID=UPI00189F33B6|nr:epoxyqueuosine reductase [Alkalibacter mobilis]MBF7096795.1 epoxyqueuosine reductase [Alkalibacter mobilis]